MKKARKSLKSLLILWFLLFSVPPLFFVGGYSIVKFEQVVNDELVERLRGHAREVTAVLTDYEKYLLARKQRHQSDASLVFHLSSNSVTALRPVVEQAINNTVLSRLSVFDSEGRLLLAFHQQDGAVNEVNMSDNDVLLPEADREKLKNHDFSQLVYGEGPGSLSLIMLTRLDTKTGRLAGYIEETVTLSSSFVEGLKKRLGLETILFNNKGEMVVGSHSDFSVYPSNAFSKVILGERETIFPLTIREEPFGFIAVPVMWPTSTQEPALFVGLGASKARTKAALQNMTLAFLTVIGVVMILLVAAVLFTARMILRPLSELVEAIQNMDKQEVFSPIRVQSENELGLLTETFNEMGERVSSARIELKNKVKELEDAYTELKDTQVRLVHSAKMASLGQLVAGVAHELNNPIGFIHSNMSHLRDYSDKLMRIIDEGEKKPERIADLKVEADYPYIAQDMPKLIQSCEDGARRTRDIVLGLRNFSRLEEAKSKKVDLQESIENTLRLLEGELKARIRVHLNFEPLPTVTCYASELNQVFMNILSNASQAIEGEGDIWITGQYLPPLHGPGQQKTESVQISIKDSGKGIPADALDKIFDPFFTTKAVGQGTGLGLSISYGIVEKHGGEIQVRSEIGKGTEFIITLPIEGPSQSH